MKKILTVGITTALLTSSLIGSAAFADTTSKSDSSTKESKTTASSYVATEEDDFLEFYKNILSKEDYNLLIKYEKEIDKALGTKDEKDDEIAFAKADALLKKYDSKILKAEEEITAKELFEIYGAEIKATDKSKIESLAKTLEKFRAAGDVTNYEKTFEELEKLLPEYNYDDEDIYMDDMYGKIDMDFVEQIKKTFSKEDFALYEKYEKELEKATQSKNAKEEDAIFDKIEKLFVKYESDLLKAEEAYSTKEIFEFFGDKLSTENKNKIESLAKTLETFRVAGDVINYEKTFDEIEKLLPEYDDMDDDYNDQYTVDDLYNFSDKELTSTEKTQIKSLHDKIIKLENADDFDAADKVYEELDNLLFD